MKKYIIIFILAALSIQAKSAITYIIKYNTSSAQYEVYVTSTIAFPTVANIGSGGVTLVFDPAFNTNVIVTVPNIGGAWVAQDKVTGTVGSLAGKKIVEFETTGAPLAGGMAANTQYLLFSFTFGGAAGNCAGSLRFIINSSDPLDPDGSGGDFTGYLYIGPTEYDALNNDPTYRDCVGLAIVPVKFLSFTAVKSGDDGLLNWKVGNEDAQVTNYQVERSLDRINFTSIATVNAKHNGLSDNNYNYTDPKLSSLRSSGVIYYRIKQFDADGKFVFSEIRTLRVKENAFEIAVYPNPAKNYIFIQADVAQAGTETIVITDASGREMNRTEYNAAAGINLQRVNTMNLAAGSYILTMHVGDQVKSIPFVKSN